MDKPKKIVTSIWQEQTDTTDIKQHNSEKIEIIKYPGVHIRDFVQQNSPVNNELARNENLNDLYNISSESGRLEPPAPAEVTVRKKYGKLSPVYSLCSFSYDDSVDLEILNKNGRYKITGYDRRVYNAVGTLWLNGRDTVSMTEIFEVMNGYARSNPSSKQLQAIEKALHKLGSIRVYIDMTQEVKKNIIRDKDVLVGAGILQSRSDKIRSAVLEDRMIHFRIGTLTSEQGRIYKSIRIVEEPCLLTYNRAKGTLLSVPMEFIGLEDSNATEKTIAFQDYLLMRIIGYQNGKLNQNTVMYDTLYRDSGIDRPASSKDFARDRETVKRLMAEWVKKGLISSFKEKKDGRSYVGITFEISDDT